MPNRLCLVLTTMFLQLLGNMSFKAREESISDFKNDDNIRVMIASLKAGGIGLDLTMANKCILVEPWWNEAIQQQVPKCASLLLSSCLTSGHRHSVVFSASAKLAMSKLSSLSSKAQLTTTCWNSSRGRRRKSRAPLGPESFPIGTSCLPWSRVKFLTFSFSFG